MGWSCCSLTDAAELLITLNNAVVAVLNVLQARVDALKREQAQTQAELDALLPVVLDKAFRRELSRG
jgi:rhamnogalacturonyl hydrolase YesR